LVSSPRESLRRSKTMKSLFGRPLSAVATLLIGALGFWGLWRFAQWAFIHAVWTVVVVDGKPDLSACDAVRGAGACWAIVTANYRFILFGFYPFEQHWRPAIVLAMVILLLLATTIKSLWGRPLLIAWIASMIAVFALMWGGFAGLPYVSHSQWGGLPVTLLLTIVGLAASFPLAVIAALARRSMRFPALRAIAIGYIETMRALPLVTLLFFTGIMLPIFMPQDIVIDKLVRAQIAIVLFVGAYMAEIVRGGLQGLPHGQSEAGRSLGLSRAQIAVLIELPQALRQVVPPLISLAIGLFKNTSLVLVVGIYDFATTSNAVTLQPAWASYGTEMFIAVGALYFIFCKALAIFGRGHEMPRER
jgi:general L-amino acid transport system permease protein